LSRLTLSLFAALCAALLLAACGGGGGTSSSGGSTAVTTATAEATPSGGEAETTPSGGAKKGGSEKNSGPPKVITEPREDETGVGVDESRKQAEAAIEKSIVASVSHSDPADCTKVEAPSFLEQTTGLSGEEAVQSCEAEAEASGGREETVNVKSVEAVGESAVADVTISGGSLDGQTVEIALRREEGNWRLGRLIGFQHFDRAAFIATLGRAMTEQGGAVAKARACVLKDLALLPTVEFENSVLEHSGPAVSKAFEACQ
jgi:hypothetical protein